MNCCDYDCNQGPNCPARVAKVGQRMKSADPLPPSIWRRHLRALARFFLLALLGWLVWVPLIYLALRA